ncbi:phospholipid phosphatase-related protein type 2, partial [Zonotrichia leucophrys gambelii]|uniref:phospholipid phosphatase-related protein type 2 n=1 Tax=Zonotrichia leucophrys gambelii TaxID=257770 RepID=UPI003140B9B0
VFSFGLLATAIFANAGQVVLGTPAPHFLPVCRPLYVTLAWRGGGSRLAKPAAVLGFAAPPFLLGALRVAEHRNSWGGVLGGFLCGTAIAAFLVTCVVGNFQNQGGDLGWGGTPRAPPELPPQNPQPPLEEISVTQVRRAEFPAVT